MTNSLAGWGGGGVPGLPLAGLEDQIREALEVKLHEQVLVVLGNPPYQGYSAAESEDERALLEPWIEPLWREWRVRKHRLGDLYVRFWRIAVQRICALTGRGIVSFITNRKWLSGRSAPAMRDEITASFDQMVIDDLGGDVRRGAGAGGSVFHTEIATGIRVGVAITTAVRTGTPDHEARARVRRRELVGTGQEKRQALERFADQALDRGLTGQPISRASRWRLGPGGEEVTPLGEYFERFESGVQPVRDDAVTDHDRAALEHRMRAYFDKDLAWGELARRHPAFAVRRVGYDPPRVRERLLARRRRFERDRVVRFAYRPFEERWLYWELEGGLLHRPRPELYPHHGLENQLYLCQGQAVRRPRPRPMICSSLPCFASVDPDARVLQRRFTSATGADGTLELGAPEEARASHRAGSRRHAPRVSRARMTMSGI